MRDAFGGIVNLAIIVVFLVIVSGYLAFNVTYTKAFRVKNKIIDEIERYHQCNPMNINNDACAKHVDEYSRQIGYSAKTPDINVAGTEKYCTANDSPRGYCVIKHSGEQTLDQKRNCYYEVVTVTSIDIPIINNIMPNLRLFQIRGDTESFECPD